MRTRMPTSAIAGTSTRTTLAMTGSDPNRSCTTSNAATEERSEFGILALKRSEQHHCRLLEHLFERLKEFCTGRTIDHAMVARHRDVHKISYHDLAFTNNRRLDRSTNGNDRGFGRIDYRRKLFYSHHSKITDGKGSTGIFVRLQLLRFRLCRQVFDLCRDLGKAFQVCAANHGSDQAFIDRHRHADVRLLVKPHRLVLI